MRKKLGPVVIAANAAVFIAFGLAFLIAPQRLADTLSITLENATALADFRAMYGGLALGMGVVFAAGLRNPAWHQPTLFLCAASSAGLLVGRVLTVSAGATPEPFIYGLMAIELISAVGAAFALTGDGARTVASAS